MFIGGVAGGGVESFPLKQSCGSAIVSAEQKSMAGLYMNTTDDNRVPYLVLMGTNLVLKFTYMEINFGISETYIFSCMTI